jgi:hypothetical protein
MVVGATVPTRPFGSNRWRLVSLIDIRLYQDLKGIIPHDQSSRVGGAYAKRRGCEPACREVTGDDGVNRGRIHDAAAACRAGGRSLSAAPHERWAGPHQPTGPFVWHLSLTDEGRPTALHADRPPTEPYSRRARAALWDVAIKGPSVAAPPPGGMEARLS